MPHDRLRFAWIPPPRAVRLPRRCMRQERQPMKKRRAPNAQPLCDHVGYGAHQRLGTANKVPTWGGNGNPRQDNALPARERTSLARSLYRPQKKGGPHSPKGTRAARALVTRSRGIYFLVLLPLATA